MAASKKPLNCVAFDCGNSSLRTVVGQYDGERIEMDVVSQVPNSTIEINGIYYWDILYIFESLKKGLREAASKYQHIDSIGICTWGVDFGLLNKDGHLLSNPLSYRNTIGDEQLSKLTDEEKHWIFEQTGIQNNRINSLYQLIGIKNLIPELVDGSKHLLMIPDLLGYLFTGEMFTEFSIASTTQVFDVKRGKYAEGVLDHFNLNQKLFKPLKQHGEVIGTLKNSIAQEVGMNPCPVICVPSHDTASAVTAVPTQEDNFLFISSGTWSLIGTELAKPILTEKVYDRDFANEGGVFNTITLLKNSTGMHILQSIKKDLEKSGQQVSWDDIVEMARKFQGPVSLFNPNSFELFNPKNMILAIQSLIGEDESSSAKVIASAYASLAFSYRYAIEQIQEITGKTYESVYVVGGGSKNAYLNQLIADLTGKKVVAGPKEATSLGNIGVQLVHYVDGFDLKKIRQMVSASEEISTFSPRVDRDICEIDAKFSDYIQLVR